MADCLGFDDVIYPVDYKVAGHIVDDEMHDIMYVCPIKLKKSHSILDQGQATPTRRTTHSYIRLLPFRDCTRPPVHLLYSGTSPPHFGHLFP